MDAPAPTYRIDIPQSDPLADPDAAAWATDAPAIQAGSLRSINDLVLQHRETERRKMIKAGAFPLPAASWATSTEIVRSDLREHKLRTEFLAEEEVVPPWAERLIERIDKMDAATNERFDAMEATIKTRFDAMEATIKTRFDAMDAATDKRFEAMNAATDKRFEAMDAATNKRFKAMEATINTRFDIMDAATLTRFNLTDEKIEELKGDVNVMTRDLKMSIGNLSADWHR
jgi:hypothetical protein